MSARTAERVEFLGDIITTAIEGGIGYWSTTSQYQYIMDGELCSCVGDLIPDGGVQATIHVMKDDGDGYEENGHRITIGTIAHGITLIKARRIGVNSAIKNAILLGDSENDAGEIDADAADVIVQAALFATIVYG